MIFGINTTPDISKLGQISLAKRLVEFDPILKYQEWYLCQISLQIMLLFVYTTTRKRFVIFTCRYFKLSWNATALNQSNCRNSSCSSILTQLGGISHCLHGAFNTKGKSKKKRSHVRKYDCISVPGSCSALSIEFNCRNTKPNKSSEQRLFHVGKLLERHIFYHRR